MWQSTLQWGRLITHWLSGCVSARRDSWLWSEWVWSTHTWLVRRVNRGLGKMEMGCASKSDSRRLPLQAKCIILPEIVIFGDSVKSPTQVSFLNKGTRTIQWRATRGEVLNSEVVIQTGNTLTKVIIQWPCKKFQRIDGGHMRKKGQQLC